MSMNSPAKLLPAELAALVHHVELNKDGWWDKTMERLVLSAIWLTDNNSSILDIQNIFKSEFRLTVSDARVRGVIDTLGSRQHLIKLPNEKFRIPDELRKSFEEEIEQAENAGANAKLFFSQLAKDLCKELHPDETWAKFESLFLAPLISEIGANAYKMIAGDYMTVNKILLDSFQKGFDPKFEYPLFKLVSKFLDPTNEAVRSYISRMLHAVFCVEASGLPETVIAKLSAGTKKSIKFRVFVDTNFLFSIMELHDNPSNLVAIELKDLIQSLNSNLKIGLYVTHRTIEEAKYSIFIAKDQLTGFPIGKNFNDAVSRAKFSGLVARYLNIRTTGNDGRSPADWFDPYLSDFVLLARENGVELYNKKLDDYAVRQDVIDDIVTVSNFEANLDDRGKSYKPIEHDMILWHLVNDNRPSYVESPVEAQDWILTLDYRLIGFDQSKQRDSGGRVPICVHPTSLIQLLQFWVPRTPEFEEAILGSMKLPFLFHDFDSEAERTSIRILKGIGRFKGSEEIHENTISQVMLNEGLRARLGTEKNADIEVQVIRDALLEEMGSQVNREKQRADGLGGKVKEQDSKILDLTTEKESKNQEIKELREKATSEESRASTAESQVQDQGKELDDFAKRLSTMESTESARKKVDATRNYLLFLIAILVISGFVGWGGIKLVASLTTITGLTLSMIPLGIIAFVSLHLILEIRIKHIEPMNQLWPFKQMSKFRKWLWSLVIFGVVGIVGSIIFSSTQENINEAPSVVPAPIEESIDK